MSHRVFREVQDDKVSIRPERPRVSKYGRILWVEVFVVSVDQSGSFLPQVR